MSKSNNNNIDHDLRPLVLLALGVLIVLGHYLYCKAMFFSSSDSVKLLHIKSISWQDDGSLPLGFYLQPGTAQQTEKEIRQITSYHPRLAPLFFLPIPINNCDEELLITIPGIGPTLARRIIDFRQQFGAIKNEEDLLRIKGIGPVKLKEITRSIIFND